MRFLLLFCLCLLASGAELVGLDASSPYAKNSKINSGKALLYKGKKPVIAINAGHGSKGGESVKTLSNPLGLSKSTNGTNKKGSIYSKAVSKGASGFKGGLSEAALNLKVAQKLRDKLLNAGYGVLMLRNSDDVQLDNIARALIANKYASIHISLHFDSTKSDTGAFCVSSVESEFITKKQNLANQKLCDSLLLGLKNQKIQIKSKENFIKDYGNFASYEDGKMFLDLTQSAYSSIPNTAIELGDLASDISDESLDELAAAIAGGVDIFINNSF